MKPQVQDTFEAQLFGAGTSGMLFLIKTPIEWDPSPLAKSWLAIISANAQAPGGMLRSFLPRGRGSYRYIVSRLNVGDPVEFASDRQERLRWYGVVTFISAGWIQIQHYANCYEAFAVAEVLRNRINKKLKAEQARQITEKVQANEERKARRAAMPSGIALKRARLLIKIEKHEDILNQLLTELKALLT